MTERAKQAKTVLRILEKTHSDAPVTYLDHKNAFEMLIATILSAHTTDASVNRATPTLFKKYPKPNDLAAAETEEVVEIIKGCGSYNKKTGFIIESSRLLVKSFGGKVPKTIDELVTLPGVSRKTANVVLSVAYGIIEGIVVDTHISRVTQRLGLSAQTTPQKIELDLMEVVPREQWYEYAKLVGAHGRRVCNAKKPLCSDCTLSKMCPSAGTF
jgi:endonuclease-3